MIDKYVLDSSIWLELERGNQVILDRCQPLIENNEVALVDAICAEVLRGTKTKKDFIKLRTAFDDFTQLSTSWMATAELAFRVRLNGFSPPLVDLYIAQTVIENKKTLITQDSDFIDIAGVRKFAVELV